MRKTTQLNKLQEQWEGLAQADPLWAVLSDPEKRNNQWTEEEFFDCGRKEIETVLRYVQSLGLVPDKTLSALDFGCGVGRLTRALSQHFEQCWGVDISPTMVRLAEDFNRNHPACNFWLNQKDNLRKFSDNYFGFIYTSIVLQHIGREYVLNYFREFVRVLRPGGVLVFQIPDRNDFGPLQKLRRILAPRRNWNRLLGRKNAVAFRMEMHCISELDIRSFFADCNARIIDVKLTNSTDESFDGNLRFLEKPARQGYVSKQYCIVKD